jgi:hypothetical protein
MAHLHERGQHGGVPHGAAQLRLEPRVGVAGGEQHVDELHVHLDHRRGHRVAPAQHARHLQRRALCDAMYH